MSIFKKKPKKKRKPQVKKMTPTAKKVQPNSGFLHFLERGFAGRNVKLIDDTNLIDLAPKPVQEKPNYILPPCKDEKPDVPELPKPEKAVSPRERESRKEFLKIFRKLTYRWRAWDVWADFITMTACAISNSVDKAHFDEREELYLRAIKKYNEEEQQLFPELFAHLVMTLEENPEQDFLGDIYTELGLNSKEHRQIFTPYHVAHMMAEVTFGDLVPQIKEKRFIEIHDCC